MAARTRTRTAWVLLVLLVLLPPVFTFGSAPTAETDLLARLLRAGLGRVAPVQLDEVSTERVEFLANALLFLPLAVLLPLALPRVPLVLLLLLPALGSLGIELAQRALAQGRVPDLVDVVANSTGAAVGLLLGADLERALARRDARRQRRERAHDDDAPAPP